LCKYIKFHKVHKQALPEFIHLVLPLAMPKVGVGDGQAERAKKGGRCVF
jgi:hypothetical protein